MKKALTLLVMVGVVGVALGMVGPVAHGRVADAQTGPSATRSFSSDSVSGSLQGELVVTITTGSPRSSSERG